MNSVEIRSLLLCSIHQKLLKTWSEMFYRRKGALGNCYYLPKRVRKINRRIWESVSGGAGDSLCRQKISPRNDVKQSQADCPCFALVAHLSYICRHICRHFYTFVDIISVYWRCGSDLVLLISSDVYESDYPMVSEIRQCQKSSLVNPD